MQLDVISDPRRLAPAGSVDGRSASLIEPRQFHELAVALIGNGRRRVETRPQESGGGVVVRRQMKHPLIGEQLVSDRRLISGGDPGPVYLAFTARSLID